MSKFKMHLKLTGLELEIEGSREDIPQIAQGVSQQLTSLLTPAARIASGSVDDEISHEVESVTSTVEPGSDNLASTRGSRKRRRSAGVVRISTTGESSTQSEVVDWRHDPAQWGTPLQSWTTKKKAVWLLYIVGKQTDRQELSAPSIAATFNRYFRAAKPIRPQNVSRDLGLATVGVGAVVAEDPTKNPSVWYLTDAGQRYGSALVAESLGRGNAPEPGANGQQAMAGVES
jgi:hypothetical protein